MEVLKTISPTLSPSAAHERPRQTRPSSRARIAGFLESWFTENCSLLTADCRLLPAFQKLLRLVQPALFGAIFISRRGLYSFNARLHRGRSFLVIAESGVRAAHQIQTLGIGCAPIEKLLERVARVAV